MKGQLRRGAFAALAASVALGTSVGIAAASSGGGLGTDSGKSGGGKGGVFPVRAKHTYGDGLGAGRGHEGQDILANCGKKIVAAKGGRVRVIDYQAGGAGNYVVISGRKFDYVYMHLLHKPGVRKGKRVKAGEKIGLVGQTGHATACHLHFEMWSSPGWYKGGGVVNPTPFLRRWDRRS
jgi:murein DD-endopeptidase MepM/ murein hydrolase activator NlpD